MKVVTLKKEHIKLIHDRLSVEAQNSGDPISPPGLREEGLLESSVGIQDSGFEGHYKYNCPRHNAAALTYSLTNNHAFHNGNKRTALVSMLAHLNFNQRTLKDSVKEEHMFCLFVCCASHRLEEFKKCKSSSSLGELKKKIEAFKGEFTESNEEVLAKKDMDTEIEIIRDWIETNSEELVDEDERKITLKQLSERVESFNFKLEYSFKTQWMTFYKKTKVLLIPTTIEYGKIKIRIPVEEKKLSKKDLSKIRAFLKLTYDDGVVAKTFYASKEIIECDVFIRKYKNVLKDLSKF